ncbi:hypothetical protein Ciccas_002638 [Cichlidogyrus casuarinus]|uniref:Uncharacterized protein n=1 Tax=Cichlidogyrus casuarinus TaxID=1844966 RepID=A0ABD2QH26_9PLAT
MFGTLLLCYLLFSLWGNHLSQEAVIKSSNDTDYSNLDKSLQDLTRHDHDENDSEERKVIYTWVDKFFVRLFGVASGLS